MSQTPDTSPPDPAAPDPAADKPEAALGAEQLAALRARAAQAEDLEDRFKRAQAEFVNEARRIQRQAEHDRRFALEGLFKDLMQVVSSLDQALAAARADSSLDALRAGVALVRQQTEDLLKRHGAEVVRPAGEAFDPVLHEAVAMVEHAELPPGMVAEVLSPGLKLHGRVSKPAQVLVTRAPAPPPSPKADEPGDA